MQKNVHNFSSVKRVGKEKNQKEKEKEKEKREKSLLLKKLDPNSLTHGKYKSGLGKM